MIFILVTLLSNLHGYGLPVNGYQMERNLDYNLDKRGINGRKQTFFKTWRFFLHPGESFKYALGWNFQWKSRDLDSMCSTYHVCNLFRIHPGGWLHLGCVIYFFKLLLSPVGLYMQSGVQLGFLKGKDLWWWRICCK